MVLKLHRLEVHYSNADDGYQIISQSHYLCDCVVRKTRGAISIPETVFCVIPDKPNDINIEGYTGKKVYQ